MKNLTFILLSLIVIASFSSCKKLTTIQPTTIDSLRIGLIAYYPMNNTGADSSGHGNDITFYRNITSATNRFLQANSSFNFDGITSYASVNDNSALRLNSTDFTINAWVNLNSFNSGNGSFVFAKRTAGVNNGWGLSITGLQSGLGIIGAVYFGPGGGNTYALGTKSIPLGKWTMITVVYNSVKQQVAIYINGVLDNVTNNIPTPNSSITSNLYIGTDNPSNFTSYYINGAFDDMRIYNRALSAVAIQKLFTSLN